MLKVLANLAAAVFLVRLPNAGILTLSLAKKYIPVSVLAKYLSKDAKDLTNDDLKNAISQKEQALKQKAEKQKAEAKQKEESKKEDDK